VTHRKTDVAATARIPREMLHFTESSVLKLPLIASLLLMLVVVPTAQAQDAPGYEPVGASSIGGSQRKIIVRLPSARTASAGGVSQQPDVRFFGTGPLPAPGSEGWDESYDDDADWPYTAPLESEDQPIYYLSDDPSGNYFQQGTVIGESYHALDGAATSTWNTVHGLADEWIFEPGAPVQRFFGIESAACDECGPIKRLFGFDLFRTSLDVGIGQDRVMHAPFEIDTTQPLQHIRGRYTASYRTRFPDRAEYFWRASTWFGPAQEQAVNWQEMRVVSETGGEKFSMFTEYPLRMLDPVNNPNTSGFGDMVIGNKTVLIDGNDWQVTQILRTSMITGSFRKGLGVGHVSMEPGLLGRFRWSDRTYLHFQGKYNIPIAGSPGFAGQLLIYGFGVSHVYYETDSFAFIPTFEYLGYAFFNGLKTPPMGAPIPVSANGDHFNKIVPGARFVLGPAGDLGLFELGTYAAFSTSSDGLYSHRFGADFRFSY
jgi:hypothetical protein